MAANNILDILTKVERPTFTIDGEKYEMRDPGELSMTEFHVLSKTGSELIAFGEQYSTDPEGAFDSISKCMDELLDMVTPDLPAKVRAQLNPFHVQKILDAFIGLSRIEPKPEEQPATKKSSRASRVSTVARRKTG